MIRYQLTIPQSSRVPLPGRKVLVSMDAAFGDEIGVVRLDGTPQAVAEVTRALQDATGRWEMELGDRTTPLDLSVAMSRCSMQTFAPELLEGRDVLARRAPPRGSTEEIAEEIADRFARWLMGALPDYDSPSSYDGERLVRGIEQSLFEWSHFRPRQASVADAVQALVPHLSTAMTHEARRRSQRLSKQSDVESYVVDQEKVTKLAGVLVAVFDAADDGDAPAVAARLRDEVRALHLLQNSQRE